MYMSISLVQPVDVVTHHTLPDFIRNRGGVSLQPGDGIIHSWLNRMLLPDTVGTGGDSHTRFPIGISFPAGSGLVAFAAATGVMPLDMPESVRVRFSGTMQPGMTLRDLVHAIPYQVRIFSLACAPACAPAFARHFRRHLPCTARRSRDFLSRRVYLLLLLLLILPLLLLPSLLLRRCAVITRCQAIKEGHLTVEKAGKKNIFSGRILEIDGVEHLKCEQAFELSDASAERSAAACTVKLGEDAVMEYLQSNIVMLKWMLSEGYGDARTIERRVAKMQAWCEDPKLMSADENAEYACTIDINLDEYTEPVLCAPNDPDDARLVRSHFFCLREHLHFFCLLIYSFVYSTRREALRGVRGVGGGPHGWRAGAQDRRSIHWIVHD